MQFPCVSLLFVLCKKNNKQQKERHVAAKPLNILEQRIRCWQISRKGVRVRILGSHLTEKIILGKVNKFSRLCRLTISKNIDWSPWTGPRNCLSISDVGVYWSVNCLHVYTGPWNCLLERVRKTLSCESVRKTVSLWTKSVKLFFLWISAWKCLPVNCSANCLPVD